jgi:hypothetical protein
MPLQVLATTNRFAGRISAQVSYGKLLFFLPPEPLPDRLVLLDFPELDTPLVTEEESNNPFAYFDNDKFVEKIIVFLTERQTANSSPIALSEDSGKKRKRRQINEIPQGFWRYAVLDDLLTAVNGDNYRWGLTNYFTLAEFQAFQDKHLPPLTARLKDAMAIRDDAERCAAFSALDKETARLYGIFANLAGKLTNDIRVLQVALDRERVRTAREAVRQAGKRGLSVDDKIALLPQIVTDEVLRELLLEIARALSENKLTSAEILATLERLGSIKRLREQTQYFPDFWEKFENVLHLEPNVTGETIDITNTREQSVTLGWDILNAKRIGPIVPGRTALVLTNERGEITHYIRGERKLKFQVQSAPNGTKAKYGCTLSMPPTPEKQRIQGFLLDVERLDTLAQLNPPAAIAAVPAAADLPPNHPVHHAATAAVTDWRQARVLADLLIELHTGADADIIRQMARSQGRKNRVLF